MNAPGKLADFVARIEDCLGAFGPFASAAPPEAFLDRIAGELARLVAEDDWLPAAHRVPGADHYRQYLLYLDPKERFCVVAFVWGPGQKTPVHDHQVWGLVGVLQGAELCQSYAAAEAGIGARGEERRLERGAVEVLSPALGDIHRVENAFADRVSISIHVYGANIGKVRRWVYPLDQPRKPFISGYGNGPDNPPFASTAL
jgi:predicted metal-dependent enzyme (double-stranded beta helix superfamily)